MRIYVEGFSRGGPMWSGSRFHRVVTPLLEPVHPAHFVETWTIATYFGRVRIWETVRTWSRDDRRAGRRYEFPMLPERLVAAVFLAGATFLQFH